MNNSNCENGVPSPSARRLEDLINDLVDLEGMGAYFNLPLLKRELGSSLSPSSAQPVSEDAVDIVEVPVDVRTELQLPSQPEGQYQTLRAFRHNPLIITAGGRVLYVEYDDEMDRVRLFLGKKKHLKRMVKSASATAALFVIDEVYEYIRQPAQRDSVLQTHRQGRELLSHDEAIDESNQPVLDVLFFNQPGDGFSTCRVRAGTFSSGLSWS